MKQSAERLAASVNIETGKRLTCCAAALTNKRRRLQGEDNNMGFGKYGLRSQRGMRSDYRVNLLLFV